MDLTTEILLAIEEWQVREGIDRVILFYNEPSTGTTYHPLSSMQSAEKNLQDCIGDLTSEYRRQRQSAKRNYV